MRKILILAANPRKDLNLDREIRYLQGVIERSQNREQFEVVPGLAVRVGDLQDLLLKHQPEIVHFCGHGSGERGLVFEGENGGEQWVRTDALSGLFRLFERNVECVLLNACYSEEQANAIVEHINYVIGMNQEIRDDAAIAFSKGFYRALGYDRPIEEAYEFGRNAIQPEISGSSKVRSAATEVERKLVVENVVATTEIPEHLKPILIKKRSLTSAPNPTLSEATRAAIQLDIDKSLEEDSKVKQYRDRVRSYLADRKLTDVEQIRLKQLQKQLGLSQNEADKILEEEQAPIHRSQQNYRDLLNELIERGRYPFNGTIQNELKQCQREEELTDGEVDEISRPILEQAEIAYQEKLRQEEQAEIAYQEKLRQEAYEKKRHRFEFEVVTVDKKGNENSRARKSAECFAEDLGKGVSLDMVMIPGGTFQMGSPAGQGDDDERPQHSVTVPSFLMAKYSITQAQWRAVAALHQANIPLDPDPSYFKGDDRPVESVSWDEAVEFCQRISRLTGHQYRLPSEAEWEYACRAGTTTPFYFGETLTSQLANYDATSTYANEPPREYREQTTPVGQFPPNAFGLYDMHGNVWEWCADHWHGNYANAPTDGSAWITEGNSEYRVARGGSWYRYPAYCRSANRNLIYPANRISLLGFRVVCAVLPGLF